MSALPCTFLLLLLLFFLGLPVLPEAKRQGKADKPRQPPPTPAAPQPAKRARNRSVPGSGELTTKGGHRCTWETSGEELVTLLVSCSSQSPGDQQRYWCRYAGKPDLCQAYGVKSSQYWKQLVGKLKKRQNACEGEKVLKAKTCKKAANEAHMKLAQRGGQEEEEAAAAEKKGGKGGGRKKAASGGGAMEKKKKEQEEEEERKKAEEQTGFGEDGVVNDMEPVQSYCAEGWHSVCSFFVKFFEG
ncbi:fibroblast growth factor-binding protein 2 [Myripristis murdjan]|nr:fibroblast growth factor-binding protein 3 [Myripristis murdjan]